MKRYGVYIKVSKKYLIKLKETTIENSNYKEKTGIE